MALDWISIQRQLKELGHYPGLIDGIAGPLTKAAVRAFQKTANLVVDGVVGPKTLAALKIARPDPDYSVSVAAELIDLAYLIKKNGLESVNKTLKSKHKVWVEKSCPVKGVEAYMLSNKCLLVPGSNSIWDYLKFNFRLLNLGMPRLKLLARQQNQKGDGGKTVRSKSGIVWHQGFFTHANHINSWVGSDPSNWPRLIVGHSLGAASAQILSTIWSAPSIGFAAPRIRKSSVPPQFENKSLSICRKDDIVGRLPRGFDRMGQTSILVHRARKFGLNHKMAAYIDAMQNTDSEIPAYWNP